MKHKFMLFLRFSDIFFVSTLRWSGDTFTWQTRVAHWNPLKSYFFKFKRIKIKFTWQHSESQVGSLCGGFIIPESAEFTSMSVHSTIPERIWLHPDETSAFKWAAARANRFVPLAAELKVTKSSFLKQRTLLDSKLLEQNGKIIETVTPWAGGQVIESFKIVSSDSGRMCCDLASWTVTTIPWIK